MNYRSRIIRATSTTGPETREMLKARAKTVAEAFGFEDMLADMLRTKVLRRYGGPRNRTYGVPGWKGLK